MDDLGSFVLAGWPGDAGPDIENNIIQPNGRVDTWGQLEQESPPQCGEWPLGLKEGGHVIPRWQESDRDLDAGSFGTCQGRGEVTVLAGFRGGTHTCVRGRGITWTRRRFRRRLCQPTPNSNAAVAVEFSNIVNETVAALTGGAVVSELSAGASVTANGFTIGVDTAPKVNSLIVKSKVTKGGVTTVEAQLLWAYDRQHERVCGA